MSDDRRRTGVDQETIRERRSMEDLAQRPRAAPIGAEGVPTQPMSLSRHAGAIEPALGQSQPRGALLGRYVVLSLLGEGGMGEVYTAYDPALDRRVALKVIKPYTDEGSLSGARALLLAEAQALAKLSHPNVVHVYDVGTIGDDVYMAMEYVEGTMLGKWLTEAPRSWPEVIEIFVEAGRGLAAAHEAGITHRDFKPENVILGKDGRVRVIDFGIALVQKTTATMVLEGMVGTPAYMAPEQFMKKQVGPPADQFSFAVALYAALFKQHAFPGDNDAALSFNVCDGNVNAPPANSGVPPRIRDAVMRALANKPEDRHPSMTAFLDAIKPAPKRSLLPYAIAGAVTLAAATAMVAVLAHRANQTEPCTGFENDLAGIWDAARKTTLQAKVKPDAWPAIEKLFDSYATDWTQNKVAACRATSVTHEQTPAVLERRMSCLDTRRRELDAAVAIVAAGGAGAAHAIEIGSNLRAPASCANLASLAPAPHVAAPAIAAVESGLAQVRAKRLAGQFRDARTSVKAVITSAQQLGWTSAVARSLVERGQAEAADGDPKGARETFFEAVRTAEEASDVASEAAAWIELVSVEGAGLKAPTEGLRWAKHAEVALAKAGNDQEQQGELFHSIAAAERVLDRNHDALEHEKKALALFEHAFGPRHVRVANQRASVSTALRLTGQLDAAIKEGEAARTQLVELVGPTHPYVATLLNGLALTYDEADRIDDARAAFEQAIQVSEQELGPTHLRLANPLFNLVALERRAGHADAAEALWTRAYNIRVANLGPTHPDVTRALHGKLVDRVNRGLDDEARALVDEVIARQRLRTDPVELPSAIAQRCELERRAGDLTAAEKSCAEALALLPKDPDPIRALFVYAFAARAAADRKDLASARSYIDLATGFLAKATHDLRVARGFVWWAGAYVALAEGKRPEATKLATDARDALLAQGKNYGFIVKDLGQIVDR